MIHGAIKSSNHNEALTRKGRPSMQRLILDALLQREGGDWVCGVNGPRTFRENGLPNFPR